MRALFPGTATYSTRACIHNSFRAENRNSSQRRQNLLSRWRSPKTTMAAEVLLWQIALDFYGIKCWRAKIEISNSSWISVSWFIDYENCYGLEFEFFLSLIRSCCFILLCLFAELPKKNRRKRIARKMASKTIQSWKQKSSMGIAGRREAMTWGWACEHDESVQTSEKKL